MSGKEKRPLVPRLRFPEFQGAARIKGARVEFFA